MRVLQVDSGRRSQSTAAQNPVFLLCRELGAVADLEQALVTREDCELARQAAAAGMPVLGTAWDIGLDPRAWWHLRRTIASYEPDIIHLHDSQALTLAATVAAGLKLVATRRVQLHIGRFAAWRRPDRIIAVSEAVKRILVADGIVAEAVAVVPDGIDVEAVRCAASPTRGVRRRLGIPAASPIVVTAARAGTEKDLGTVIRAARVARETAPDLHWLIAGDGKMRLALRADVLRLDVRDRVHWVAAAERIEPLIAEATVFVGSGSLALMALALGRPAISIASGDDPAAIAEKALALVRDPASVPFPEYGTAAAMTQGVLDVYASLL